MMDLQYTLPQNAWLDYERFDFCKDVGDQILQMSECHSSTDKFNCFSP